MLLTGCFPNPTHFNVIQSQCFCLTKQYRYEILKKFCKKKNRNLWRKMPATATLRTNYKKTKTLNLGAQVTLEVQKIASISSFGVICQAHIMFSFFCNNHEVFSCIVYMLYVSFFSLCLSINLIVSWYTSILVHFWLRTKITRFRGDQQFVGNFTLFWYEYTNYWWGI